jgi:hypothetical protein
MAVVSYVLKIARLDGACFWRGESMRRRRFLAGLAFAAASWLWAGGGWATGQEIGFIERFALAADRERALAELTPGTDDYYFFHALHYQNTGQLDKVPPLVRQWLEQVGSTPRLLQIQHRQALLTYDQDHDATLEYLRNYLGLRFDHRRELPGAERNLPTALDPAVISFDRLAETAFRDYNRTDGFEDAALDALAARNLNDDQLVHVLERMVRPDHPNLVALVTRQLKMEHASPFGSLPIHLAMTQVQLDQLADALPNLLNEPAYIQAYLAKLRPSDDIDWRRDEAAYLAYLERAWQFATRLDAAHNSLKANVLFRRLDYDRRHGVYEKERFIEYLKLPRSVFYINERLVRNVRSQAHIADLGADYGQGSILPPVADDQVLVRDYLHHFLRDAENTREFATYFDDEYLRRQFAEVKIVNGLGEKEHWAAQLSPSEYQSLIERIDLDFALTNPRQFAVDQPVALTLYTKNIETLIVKVFQINTGNYYRSFGREVDTDINLDGLVPHSEQVFTYTDGPERRMERTFTFDELQGRGVWVIDFIGNGKSSRALVRKGELVPVVETTIAGQRFTILDENRNIVTGARLWCEGSEYTAGEDGRILVPFSTQPDHSTAIISHGQLSSLCAFYHEAETYELIAGMYVDRESLLRGHRAQVLIRPALMLNGVPVPLNLLKDIRLKIQSVDLDGIASSLETSELVLDERGETTYEIQTPTRLRQLSLELSAKVENVSQGTDETLVATQSLGLNEIDATESIRDVHLVKGPAGYHVEVRGKTGEPRPKQAVLLSIKHRLIRQPYSLTLQTDDRGQIFLGHLDDIASLEATVAGTPARAWSLDLNHQSHYSTIHGIAGRPVIVPWFGPGNRAIGEEPDPNAAPADVPSRDALALLEKRGGTYVGDRFEAIGIEPGRLVISGLERGDYELVLKATGEVITIRISDGPETEGLVVGPARILERRGTAAAEVRDIDISDDAITIQLGGATEFARVQVFATRHWPRFDVYRPLAQVRDAEPQLVAAGYAPSAYLAGRDIGDEYRYILDRKYAKRFPGNMLDRPSLLLNPWSVRTTESTIQEALAGGDFGAEGGASATDATGTRGQSGRGGVAMDADPANLDFLVDPTAIVINVRPDKDGVVTIRRADLGDKSIVRLVVLDPLTTTVRHLVLPGAPPEIRDLRLATALDPEQHFAQLKQTAIVRAEETFELDDVAASKFQQYDDLGDVYRLFIALSGDATLAEFQFIVDWSSKTEDQRRELYSKYACHELNYFLARKDPKFFADVVVPYLENKRAKTFLDEWLLNHPVDGFLAPWQFDRLNVAERILLAQRLPDRQPMLARNIAELYQLSPTRSPLFDRLYDVAVKSSALDVSGVNADVSGDALRRGLELRLGAARENPDAPLGDVNSMPAPAPAGGGMGGGGYANAPESAAAPADGGQPGADNGLLVLDPSTAAKSQAGVMSVEEMEATRRMREDALGDNESLAYRLEQQFEAANYYFEADKKLAELRDARKDQAQLYRRIKPTEEWVESQYYHLPIDQMVAARVPINRFWRDYTEHRGDGPFLSPYFPEAHRNFTEMMLALAVLDLPFAAAEHDVELADNRLTIKAASDAIVFHQQVHPAVFDARGSTILISENFFRADDRYRQDGDQRYDKFVTEEFLTHVLYGSQVVLTNPSSTPHAVDLLVQIPQGSLPAQGTQPTRSVRLDLPPFSTQTLEYYFYFPAAGRQPHYPAHVAIDERIVAVASPLEFNVVDDPTQIDRASWAFVSQNGTDDEVIQFLERENVLAIDLSKIAFRMGEPEMFRRVIDTLRTRLAYNATLWSYSVRHDDQAALVEFLAQTPDFLHQCGTYLQSSLVHIDPVDRRWYEHREYWPLVNARAHALGARRQLTNAVILAQYQSWLDYLAYRPSFDADDRMGIVYYLLVQDRVDEALQWFQAIDAAELATRLQYDYLTAYLAMYQGQPAAAGTIAARYTSYPVERWRKLFQTVAAHVTEATGGEPAAADPVAQAHQQAEQAAREPSLDFFIEARQVTVNYRNLSAVTVNYYTMDVELLFSRNPFVQNDTEGFAMIRPNLTQEVALTADQTKLTFDLPAELRNANVLVEIVAGDQTRRSAYYAHSLALQVIEPYGQLQVVDEATGKPLAGAYVKAYARKTDGRVVFFKDGYTDLRGRFDYATLSNQPLDDVERFSILVLSDAHGAVVREAAPPSE